MSPRMWGWTGTGLLARRARDVVPTHVGVDRSFAASAYGFSRCPHACGGGPRSITAHATAALVVPTHVGVDRTCPTWIASTSTLSPRMWGWTELTEFVAGGVFVVPTHVGVDRSTTLLDIRAPALSPRMWGWTEASGQLLGIRPVVPTHVGVDRNPRIKWSKLTSCPHACGGGPSRSLLIACSAALSPRMWGWTGTCRHQAQVT